MIRIVVLISGSGSNLQALIDGCKTGAINGEIKAVISNKPGAYGLTRAQDAGIEALCLDHTAFASREAFDTELQHMIDDYSPDLLVLAGFMRILTPGFTRRYLGSMINIHPSLLPKYPGLHTHQRALDAGDTKAGVTVHFVTPELDDGPNIVQATVPILENDSADTVAARVLSQEHQIYPLAVQWFATGRLRMDGNQALLDGSPLPPQGHPYNEATSP